MKSLTILALLTLAANASARAADTELPLNKMPENVQKGVHEAVGSGKITKTVKETEKDGSVIYEVAYTVGDKKFEAEISPDGKIKVIDEEITLTQAPEAAQKTMKEQTAGGSITKIEKCTKGEEVSFEAEFTKSGTKHEVKVAPDGKVIDKE
jgi:uncharacterized membrane protein YkoI